MNFKTKPIALALSAVFSAGLLTGCLDSSSHKDDHHDHDHSHTNVDKSLVFINSTTGEQYIYDFQTRQAINLNDKANASTVESEKKLNIEGQTNLSHFIHWPDFRIVNEVMREDKKVVLMNDSYTGGDVDANHFFYLAHFHGSGEERYLAAHSADEFENLPEGHGRLAGLARLNNFINSQTQLESDLAAQLPEGQTLCKAYVDPYLKHKDGVAENTLVHYTLTTTGRMYFYQKEGENFSLVQNSFETLDGVTSIENCNQVTITRQSDDGVYVFVPNAEHLYFIDRHGADFHLHERIRIDSLIPAGVNPDIMGAIGEGKGH
ncbi:hypothetical protein JX580_11150 [Thiomicrospira microaerophila]|uniref:hypothetical protein n=1 Tax=Thiomicrospira microaerophila TaxID=406020 RepID=UPI00200DFCB3|nr:hypothetical protein [Thiomicrospira microaerophila]UQB42195.1 hypothetical protein JX580_11150 [Thiomicrospira microaerophila]